MNFWNNYTLEELEKLIEEKPLTKESMNYVLHNRIKKIIFNKDSTLAAIIPHNKRYKILIGLQQSLEEQEADLIHEICHAYYRAGTGMFRFGPERKKIEEMLEKEAQRFYKENKDFVKQIYSRLSNKLTNCN